MNYRCPISWICLLTALGVHAADPVGEMPQLMQLNRASQQELQRIQSAPPTPAAADPAERPWRKKAGDRRQQSRQQELQEAQRRELLLERQRAKATNKPPTQRRLDAIGRQRQFRTQQKHQLNRFRARQGAGSR